MKKRKLALFILFLPIIFSSLENYYPDPLSYVTKMVTPFVKEDKGVYVAYKPYDNKDSKKYLDRDLVSRGFRPVQITIQNNSAALYLFSTEGCSLKVAKPSSVAWSITKSTIPRAIGYKIAGFLFWPFMIPGAIDSIRTFRTHVNLTNDFYAKSIKEDDELILPYSTVHRIAFVKEKDYHEDFRISVINQETNEDIVFDTPAMTLLEEQN